MRIINIFFFLTIQQIFFITQGKSLDSDYNKFISGLESREGFVNYYWDDNKGRLYLEVEDLNSEFLYVNYLSAGLGSNDIGLDRGQIGGTRIVKFIKMGPKVFMVQPNYKYRAVSNNLEEVRSVSDAFAQSTLWAFDIIKTEKNKYLVDATDFVIRDSHKISQRLSQGKQGTFTVDKPSSSFDIVNSRNFPLNSELEAFLTFRG